MKIFRAFLVALLLAASSLFVGNSVASAGYHIKVSSCYAQVIYSGGRYGSKAKCTQSSATSTYNSLRAYVACTNETGYQTGWLTGPWGEYFPYPDFSANSVVMCPSSNMTVYAYTFQVVP